MPDMPINQVLPVNDPEVNTRIKWLTYLQGGGLAIFVAVLAISATSVLFKALMDDRNEDRQTIRDETKRTRDEDKEFRQQMLNATIEHTTATVRQTTVQEKTNEGLEEVKDALVGIRERIENLADNEAETAKRLDRMIEKAWTAARPNPSTEQPN